MNNNETIQKLKQMRLGAMADLHSRHISDNTTGECTADEYLSMLTDHEWEHRNNRKIQRLIQQADFRQKASVEEINYALSRNLDKNSFQRLATLSFIEKCENIIITGPSGVGKSYLGQALGYQACFFENKVQYTTTARLFSRLKLSKVDGTYLKEIQKLNKVKLLILDDFGLQAFDNFAREALMEIIDERFGNKSTIISSQLPVSTWYEIIGESTIADAILDRIVHSSHRINLKGESLRKGMLKDE